MRTLEQPIEFDIRSTEDFFSVKQQVRDMLTDKAIEEDRRAKLEKARKELGIEVWSPEEVSIGENVRLAILEDREIGLRGFQERGKPHKFEDRVTQHGSVFTGSYQWRRIMRGEE